MKEEITNQIKSIEREREREGVACSSSRWCKVCTFRQKET